MKTLPTNWTIDYARPDSDKTGLCIRQGDKFFAFEGAQADIIIASLRAAEQRGIERAAEWLLRDTQTDNRKEAAEAIRALAQGGEK